MASIVLLSSCNSSSHANKIQLIETNPGHYEGVFEYDLKKSDRFPMYITLLSGNLNPDLMESHVTFKVRHQKGSELKLKYIDTSYTLNKNTELTIYQGPFHLIDNNSLTSLLSCRSDGNATFSIKFETSIPNQKIILNHGYASGGFTL